MKFSSRSRTWVYSLGIGAFLLATYLAGTKFIYYVWLNAYDPEKYPAEVVEGPAYIALAIAILFFCMFIFCIYKLVKNLNRKVNE